MYILQGSSATPRYLQDPCEHHVNQQLPGVKNGSAEPCGVDSSTEDQPNIFPCAASRFFYDARV